MFMFQLACSSKQWLWYLVIYLCPLNVLFLYIDTYTYIYTYICWCPSFIWIRCSSIIGYVHSIGSHTNKNTNIFMLLYRNSCIFLSIVQTYTYIHTIYIYIHTSIRRTVPVLPTHINIFENGFCIFNADFIYMFMSMFRVYVLVPSMAKIW